MVFHAPKTVVRETLLPALTPVIAITIAIDTAYAAAQQGKNLGQCIYMMDNMVSSGSSQEGTLELSTVGPVGSLIGFNSVPIDINAAADGASVAITGFVVSQGNVFGAAGYPRAQRPDYWIGQLMNQGSQTYQIQIKVTVGALRPVSYFFSWDPFIAAQ
jgi:hypothetical protein